MGSMKDRLPADWKQGAEGGAGQRRSSRSWSAFVEAERREEHSVPAGGGPVLRLAADAVRPGKVLVLGQDPYHGAGQAHGLASRCGRACSPRRRCGTSSRSCRATWAARSRDNGYLMPWAEQGVLLLNAVLTVRAREPNSHKGKGWEKFTDAVIRAVDARAEPVRLRAVGRATRRRRRALIDTARHVRASKAAHPSPLSAKKGFFGSRPFSRANAALEKAGRGPSDWALPS